MEQQKELSLRDFYDSYQYNKSTLDKALSKLEEEAETIRGQAETRQASQERIATAQREIASLKGEKSDLFGQWQQAEFDDATGKKKELKNRRKQIDARIAELEETIRDEREAMPEVDSKHAAEVKVALDMLKPLNVDAFVKRLKAMLEGDAADLNERIRAIQIPGSAFNREEYERIRAGRDNGYALQLAQNRRLATKEAEKRAKMRDISNTSDMADAMGSRRRPEDRLNVKARGHKVKGYSERRVSNDEEPDRTHVLSGDEVRAALAAKQQRKAS